MSRLVWAAPSHHESGILMCTTVVSCVPKDSRLLIIMLSSYYTAAVTKAHSLHTYTMQESSSFLLSFVPYSSKQTSDKAERKLWSKREAVGAH